MHSRSALQSREHAGKRCAPRWHDKSRSHGALLLPAMTSEDHRTLSCASKSQEVSNKFKVEGAAGGFILRQIDFQLLKYSTVLYFIGEQLLLATARRMNLWTWQSGRSRAAEAGSAILRRAEGAKRLGLFIRCAGNRTARTSTARHVWGIAVFHIPTETNKARVHADGKNGTSCPWPADGLARAEVRSSSMDILQEAQDAALAKRLQEEERQQEEEQKRSEEEEDARLALKLQREFEEHERRQQGQQDEDSRLARQIQAELQGERKPLLNGRARTSSMSSWQSFQHQHKGLGLTKIEMKQMYKDFSCTGAPHEQQADGDGGNKGAEEMLLNLSESARGVGLQDDRDEHGDHHEGGETQRECRSSPACVNGTQGDKETDGRSTDTDGETSSDRVHRQHRIDKPTQRVSPQQFDAIDYLQSTCTRSRLGRGHQDNSEYQCVVLDRAAQPGDFDPLKATHFTVVGSSGHREAEEGTREAHARRRRGGEGKRGQVEPCKEGRRSNAHVEKMIEILLRYCAETANKGDTGVIKVGTILTTPP
jgi:hypothetical protein